MGSMVTGRGRRYVADAARAFERAPAEVTIAVVLAAAFSYAIETGGDAMRSWLELAVTGVLLGAAAWTGTLLEALGAWPARRRWIVTGAGAVLAAAYGLFVLDFERAAEGWRAAMLVAAAVLWLAAVPYFQRRSIDDMRAVTGRVLLRVLGALLYAAALFAGLALALSAVNTLFELRLDGEIYGHVFGWIFMALAPWIVFGGLDDYVREGDSDVAGVIHRMSAYLVPPLLVIYYAILYAYTVRIAVTGEVPKNLVSPLVFAAGVLVALALLLFDPRHRAGLSATLLRAAPPLFVPLAALGVWTITMRVGQYGWTEFRLLRLVLLVVLGLLAVAGSVQLARRQRFALHVVPLALAAVLVLAAVGPWGVTAVARASQQDRLDAALSEANLDPAVPPPAVPREERPVPAALYDEISSTAHYLHGHFGPSALPPALAVGDARGDIAGYDDAFEAVRRLGLRPFSDVTRVPEVRFGRLGPADWVDVGALRVRRISVAARGGGAGAGAAVAVQDGDLLRIRVDELRLSARLDELAATVDGPREPGAGGRPREPGTAGRPIEPATVRPREPGTGELPAGRALLVVHDETGRARGWLLVLEVNLEVGPGTLQLHHLDALLLLEP